MPLRWERGRYHGLDNVGNSPGIVPDRRRRGEPISALNADGYTADGSASNSDKVDVYVLTWGELGCPREIGLYRAGDHEVRVKKIHIVVAENDPAAQFTVVELRPPGCPPEFTLGHRVA